MPFPVNPTTTKSISTLTSDGGQLELSKSIACLQFAVVMHSLNEISVWLRRLLLHQTCQCMKIGFILVLVNQLFYPCRV
jgi:hypothetical protein